LNKDVRLESNLQANQFILTNNGELLEIDEISFSGSSKRIIIIETVSILRSDQALRISYRGSGINAIDETILGAIENLPVLNTLDPIHVIPGTIEAENFFFSVGIALEDCTDVGQGQNIAHLDAGDYLEYEVSIETDGLHKISYRVASLNTSGELRLSLADDNILSTVIDEATFPVTNGWQVWRTVEKEIPLSKGDYILRIDILNAPFNLNWLTFEALEIEEPPVPGIFVSPNPFVNTLNLSAFFSVPHQVSYALYDVSGQLIKSDMYKYTDSLNDEIELTGLSAGFYILEIHLEDDTKKQFKLLKQ